MPKNEIANKRFPIVLVILAALILIAIVIWVFDKRIHGIENKMENKPGSATTRQSTPHFLPKSVPFS
jgi:hypothetical protein